MGPAAEHFLRSAQSVRGPMESLCLYYKCLPKENRMKYLLGTDIGTSGTKTILMDTEGKLIAKHLVEYDAVAQGLA